MNKRFVILYLLIINRINYLSARLCVCVHSIHWYLLRFFSSPTFCSSVFNSISFHFILFYSIRFCSVKFCVFFLYLCASIQSFRLSTMHSMMIVVYLLLLYHHHCCRGANSHMFWSLSLCFHFNFFFHFFVFSLRNLFMSSARPYTREILRIIVQHRSKKISYI